MYQPVEKAIANLSESAQKLYLELVRRAQDEIEETGKTIYKSRISYQDIKDLLGKGIRDEDIDLLTHEFLLSGVVIKNGRSTLFVSLVEIISIGENEISVTIHKDVYSRAKSTI